VTVKWLVMALGCLVAGCVSWLLDVQGLLCLPNSWLQLHALWHVFMAGAILFLFLYYWSERR
jgi:hypothetical protein